MNATADNANSTATTESAARPASGLSGLPRRPRIGSALASVAVTVALFGSVVLGMTATDAAAAPLVARASAASAARA